MKINASHFKTMEELIKHINMCVKEEDIFALERYVGLNELDILIKEIARLNKIIDRARHFLEHTCYYNERALTFSECNKLFNMLDKEEMEEGK